MVKKRFCTCFPSLCRIFQNLEAVRAAVADFVERYNPRPGVSRSLGITRRSRRARSMSYARRHGTNVCPGNRVRDTLVPKDRALDDGEVPPTYVPARNTVLLSLALACAEVLGSQDLFIGVNALDYSGYPDCRPEFVQAFERLATLATKAGIEGRRPLRVHTPLIDLTKADIIRRGVELGVDYALTHSCYDPDPDGRPCSRCDSCRLRARGFEEAGLPDPALI